MQFQKKQLLVIHVYHTEEMVLSIKKFIYGYVHTVRAKLKYVYNMEMMLHNVFIHFIPDKLTSSVEGKHQNQ